MGIVPSFQKTSAETAEREPAFYRLAYWRAQVARRENRVLLLLTLVIGALAGLAVVGFIVLTERLGARLYPPTAPVWRRLIGPAAGALSMGYVLSRFFPDARGNGVLQTRAALYLPDARITLHAIVGKFVCTSLTLASGIPLGPEGPSVEVGAGIASVLGRTLGLKPEKIRTLLPVGAAAAIAAAFNTPVAAVLFSLEEIVGDLQAPVLGSVVLASATAWMVLRLLLGNNPLFHTPQYELVNPIEFVFYGALGLATGVASGSFVWLVLWSRKQFRKLPVKSQWAQPLVAGVLVGVAAIFAPQALGVGYVYINAVLGGHVAIKLAAALMAIKLVTSAISSSSGNAGGVFAPALFIGAMLGGAYGGLTHSFFPHVTAGAGAYALVGMGAAFAGIIRTPMTSVVLVFEVTRDYSIIVPLMIANLLSYFVSQKIQRLTLYEGLARQDGIHLAVAGPRVRSDARLVGQVMHKPQESLDDSRTVDEACVIAERSKLGAWPVLAHGKLAGIVSSDQLRKLQELGQGATYIGHAIASSDPAGVGIGHAQHVHVDEELDVALDRMGRSGLPMLAVVSRLDLRQMLGVIYLSDILNAYRVAMQSPDCAGDQVKSGPQAIVS